MTGSDPKSDPSSDPKVATHTTNGKFAQKLLINRFVPKIIPVVIQPINPPIIANVMGVQDILSSRQTVILKESVIDDARSCVHIFWGTSGKVSRTSRDDAMPRKISSDENSRLSSQGPNFIGNYVYSTRTGNQDISSPSHPSIAKRGRNADLLDTSINKFSAVNDHYTSYFSGGIGLQAVSAEVADINPRKRMNFTSNSVLGENPKFVDLKLSPAHTMDKPKSVIGPATIAGGLTEQSDWLASRHRIAEVTVVRVSEVQANRDYIKNSGFETSIFFELENTQLTRQDQNIQLT